MSQSDSQKISFSIIINRFGHKESLLGTILKTLMKWPALKRKAVKQITNENPVSNSSNSTMPFEMSGKVGAKCYKGIFYLHLAQLPAHQKYSILKWSALKTIKIKTENVLLTDCIQYDKYESWYNKEYKQLAALLESEVA